MLFIGIGPDGTVTGVTNSDDLQRTVRTQTQEKIYPPVQVELHLVYERGMTDPILAIVVPFSHNSPHFAGPAFVRVGSESVKASHQAFEELIVRRLDMARFLIEVRDSGAPAPFRVRDRSRERLWEAQLIEINAHFATFESHDPHFWRNSYPLSKITLSRFSMNNQVLVTPEKGL